MAFCNSKNVTIKAIPSSPYAFSKWIGKGSGNYTGSKNPANVVMKGPIIETANFYLSPTSKPIIVYVKSVGIEEAGSKLKATVRVVDQKNKPVSNANVTVQWYCGQEWPVTTKISDKEGSAVLSPLPLPLQKYNIIVGATVVDVKGTGMIYNKSDNNATDISTYIVLKNKKTCEEAMGAAKTKTAIEIAATENTEDIIEEI